MSQKISQGNIFGRIGSGIGQGLAEQLPKEIERGRLASGLQELGKQQGLTPFQQFSGLASLPGTTPQIIQSGGDILRQQAYLDAVKNQYQGQGGPKGGQGYTPTKQDVNVTVKGEMPTLADPESTSQSYKSYIPPTEQEERKDAFENFNANPARYNYDFDKALNERKAITSRNQEIQSAYQNQEKTAVDKEEKVKTALDNEIKKLGLSHLPPKSKQKFEEKILNAVLSKKDGGEGLTQEQAIKKYSEQLRQADRDYADLGSLSSWSPRDFNRRTNAMQKNFSSRGEQQMMMDQLIADYNVSPTYAAHKAYPIQKGDMPTLNKLETKVGTPTRSGVSVPVINQNTYANLKKEMGKKNSPLSVAYELQNIGEDPRPWLNYLDTHRDDLEVWQADQLKKNVNILDLKDRWLNAWE